MRKRRLSVLLLLVILLSISVCNSSIKGIKEGYKSNKTDTKITLILGTNKTDLANSKLPKLVNDYSKLHPNITIKIEVYKDTNTELKIKAAAGDLPDIGPIPDDANSKNFLLYYEPINDLGFNEDNLYGYEYGIGQDGRLYALNSAANYSGIIYNKKSFKIAGIINPPVTLDEFYEDCNKLKAQNITPFASNFREKWPLSLYSNDCVLPIANTGNGDYKNDLVKHKLFDDDHGLKTSFDFLRGMYLRGFLEPNLMATGWKSMNQEQAKGTIAMTYLGSWYLSQVVDNGADKSDVGMFPFPGSKVIPQSPDWLFGVSKNSKHIPEAKALLKWLWQDGRYAKACGMNPPLKDAKVDDSSIKEILSYKLPVVDIKSGDSSFNKVYKDAQIDLQQALQEYITAKDPQAVLYKYNQKWENAKKQN